MILLTLITAAFSYPAVKTWPLNELHETFSKLPEGDPLRPYLEEGAGLILGPIFEGKNTVRIKAKFLALEFRYVIFFNADCDCLQLNCIAASCSRSLASVMSTI